MQTALAKEIHIPRRTLPRGRVATPEELIALFENATPTMRMFLALTSILALRIAEAQRLGWKHYDAAKQTITVETKGHSIKTFPVPDEVAALIRVCPGPDQNNPERGFLELLEGKRLTCHSIYDRWQKLRDKSGVPPTLNPHDLRRTAAVRAYKLTKDVFAAKALLGHKTLASTAWYLTPHEPAAMNEATEALKRWTPRGERVQ